MRWCTHKTDKHFAAACLGRTGLYEVGLIMTYNKSSRGLVGLIMMYNNSSRGLELLRFRFNTPSNFDSIPSSNGTYSINPTTGLDEAFSFSSTFFGFNFTTFFKPTVSNVHSQPSSGLDPIIGINTTLLSFDSRIRSIDPNPTTVMLSPNPTIEFNRAFSLAEPTILIRLSV
jgi:hypothetical protein